MITVEDALKAAQDADDQMPDVGAENASEALIGPSKGISVEDGKVSQHVPTEWVQSTRWRVVFKLLARELLVQQHGYFPPTWTIDTAIVDHSDGTSTYSAVINKGE